MGRKKKNTIDLTKVELSEQDRNIAKKKVIITVLLCIMWPLTLFLLMPHVRTVMPQIIFYALVVISAINVYMTIEYTKFELDDVKYEAYVVQSKYGKIERFAGLLFIFEVAFILFCVYVIVKYH